MVQNMGIPCEDYTSISNIDNLSTVIYFGSLYAGGVMGLRKTLDRMNIDDKRIIFITVGLSDPDDEHNIQYGKLYDGTAYRGCIQQAGDLAFKRRNRLRQALFFHHAMMKFLYSGAGKTRNPDDETRAMINTYGKKVSFINFDSLNKIEL